MAKVNYERGSFARFFRAVKGRHMSRYGTASQTAAGYRAATIFGGHRPPMKEGDTRHDKIRPLTHRPCNPIQLDTEMITAITHSEASRYRREYDRATKVGDLEECTEEEYVKWLYVAAGRLEKDIKKSEKLTKEREKSDSDAAEKLKMQRAARAKKLATEAAKAGYKAPSKKGSESAPSSKKKGSGPDAASGSDSKEGAGGPEE